MTSHSTQAIIEARADEVAAADSDFEPEDGDELEDDEE